MANSIKGLRNYGINTTDAKILERDLSQMMIELANFSHHSQTSEKQIDLLIQAIDKVTLNQIDISFYTINSSNLGSWLKKLLERLNELKEICRDNGDVYATRKSIEDIHALFDAHFSIYWWGTVTEAGLRILDIESGRTPKKMDLLLERIRANTFALLSTEETPDMIGEAYKYEERLVTLVLDAHSLEESITSQGVTRYTKNQPITIEYLKIAIRTKTVAQSLLDELSLENSVIDELSLGQIYNKKPHLSIIYKEELGEVIKAIARRRSNYHL